MMGIIKRWFFLRNEQVNIISIKVMRKIITAILLSLKKYDKIDIVFVITH